MGHNFKNRLLPIMVGFICIYFSLFFLGHFFYMGYAFFSSFTEPLFPIKQILWLITVGLSLSLLAVLCSWPFALSIATLIEQTRKHQATNLILSAIKFLASMPLVLFVYLFLEVIGQKVFNVLENFWTEIFASVNWFTQGLAFTFTLLFYPLTVVPGVEPKGNVDLFFKKMLVSIIGFAEVGLVSSVVVFGLFIYILPQMILRMLKQMNQGKSIKKYEAIQAIGGTQWESIYMTVLQSMKEHFNFIVIHFTRLCFFEGLITLSLLSFFFNGHQGMENHWSASLSSIFLNESVYGLEDGKKVMILAGTLSFVYFLFMLFEKSFEQESQGRNV